MIIRVMPRRGTTHNRHGVTGSDSMISGTEARAESPGGRWPGPAVRGIWAQAGFKSDWHSGCHGVTCNSGYPGGGLRAGPPQWLGAAPGQHPGRAGGPGRGGVCQCPAGGRRRPGGHGPGDGPGPSRRPRITSLHACSPG